ncbi:hypothetical protein MTR67_003474, partial [Solanum verrucosum]
MVVLDRFSGGNDPVGWILRAEQYFACLGFSKKDWLPLPYFYLDGKALIWFTWLHRNKKFFDWRHFTEKLLMRFPQRTFTASADHILETLPEKYTNVDSLALLTGSNAEIVTLEGMGTPQIGNAKSVGADLVQEPSSITKGQVFDEILHTIVSSDIPEPNDRFCEYVNMQTKVPTSVLNDTKGSNNVEENSPDTVGLFDTSPQRDASVYPIATGVPLLVPLVGREVMMANEHLKQAMPTRYVFLDSLGSGSPKWKTDIETFRVGTEDLFLDKYFLENESAISTSAMHSVGLLSAAENGKSIGGFNGQYILSQFPFDPAANFLMLIVTIPLTTVDLCVWDPGICFGFMALTGYIENVKELLLLRCTDTFLLFAYSNRMSRVWDPGQQGSVKSWFKGFSVVNNCTALTCLLIAYSLVFAEYYAITHVVFLANFQQTSALHLRYITAIVGMLQYFEVNNSRFDESEHVMKYHLYHISSALGPPFDPNSNLDEILSIPLSDTTTYILVTYGNISFDRKWINAKEECNDKGITAPISHLSEVLLENMIKILNVAANSASTSLGDIIRCIGLLTSLGDIIRCIALLDTSHISTHLCHFNQLLSKTDATMSIILQAANQVASLLLTNLTVPVDAHAYSNLEDRALIGVSGIVMNGPRPDIPKQPDTILRGYVWDP